MFSQNDLRAIGSSTSPSKEEAPSLVSPAVEAEILREAALSRLFSLGELYSTVIWFSGLQSL